MGILDDLNNIFNPSRNGIGSTLGGFFNNTVSPLVSNLYSTFLSGPMKLFQSIFSAGSSLLSGSGFTYILIGVGGLIVVGGLVYYQTKK